MGSKHFFKKEKQSVQVEEAEVLTLVAKINLKESKFTFDMKMVDNLGDELQHELATSSIAAILETAYLQSCNKIIAQAKEDAKGDKNTEDFDVTYADIPSRRSMFIADMNMGATVKFNVGLDEILYDVVYNDNEDKE